GDRGHRRARHHGTQPPDVVLADQPDPDHAHPHRHDTPSRPWPARYLNVRSAIGFGLPKSHGYMSCSTTVNSSASSCARAASTDGMSGSPWGGSTLAPMGTPRPNARSSASALASMFGSICLMWT